MEDLRKMVSSPNTVPAELPTDGFIPQLRRNCCYIVSAVIIDQNKVVLIQEAKLGCRGKWYLPAGRVERGETLIQAAKREVLEEAGLMFAPKRVVGIEGSSPGWMRINFIGEVIGGELKTHEDKESLQAKWFDIDEVVNSRIPLRAGDIIPVIKSAVEQEKTQFTGALPVEIERPNYTISLVVVHDNQNNSISLIEDASGKFPTAVIPKWNPAGEDRYTLDILEIAERICKDQIGLETTSNLKFGRVLSLAHDGRQGNDGIHFTLLYFSPHLSSLGNGYTWQSSNDSCIRELVLSDKVMPLK